MTNLSSQSAPEIIPANAGSGSVENTNSLSQGLEQVHAGVEKISAMAGSGNQTTVAEPQKSQTGLSFASISDQIWGMISAKPKKNAPLPSIKVQSKLVQKSIKKEQSKLLKKANKIQQSRRFSASELEKVLLQVRHLQKLLEELVTAAAERIEFMYKKFVLKTA